MSPSLATIGRAILRGVEVSLALVALFSVWLLGDISSGVDAGAYNAEAASGFAIGFLALYILAFTVLVILLASHAALWYIQTQGQHRVFRLRDASPRLVLEATTGIVLAILFVGIESATTSVGVLTVGTVGLCFWVLAHNTIIAGRWLHGLLG